MGIPEIAQYFDSQAARMINQKRLEHLASLGLDLEGKRVLEVGAGVGHLTGFWEERGCDVVCTEGRPMLVKEHRRRYPHRKVIVADLSHSGSHANMGKFDVVFCYGTLYHVGKPEVAINSLAGLCKEMFLLETRVNPRDNGEINLISESLAPNQSLHGMGCRPGRDWIMAELGKYFPYVYATATQPDYPDHVTKWPASRIKARAVFVALRKETDLPTLTAELPMEQEKHKK